MVCVPALEKQRLEWSATAASSLKRKAAAVSSRICSCFSNHCHAVKGTSEYSVGHGERFGLEEYQEAISEFAAAGPRRV